MMRGKDMAGSPVMGDLQEFIENRCRVDCRETF
jgi:hypothetical protein